MMYVKHVPVDDHENIYEAVKVTNITFNAAQRACPDGKKPSVSAFGFFLATPEGKHLQFTKGEVFVMNAEGQTIQRYTIAGFDGYDATDLPVNLDG